MKKKVKYLQKLKFLDQNQQSIFSPNDMRCKNVEPVKIRKLLN